MSSSGGNSLPTNKTALQETVKVLRCHAEIKRIKVSRASTDLMNYCLEHAKNDYLLPQGGSSSGNPYKEGKNCPVM
ncbi:predicted protein, partial [Nematostella vectensis]